MDVSNCICSSISNRSSYQHATGFSLIEVLVTLCITSVGLLSLAALQIQGLRCTHSAILRTHAVTYVTEMAEQLHSAATPSPDTPSACSTDPCTVDSVNAAAIEEWQAHIHESLPQGAGTVSFGVSSATVQVDWDDHGEARQFSLSLEL